MPRWVKNFFELKHNVGIRTNEYSLVISKFRLKK